MTNEPDYPNIDMPQIKEAPHSLESEQAVLGGIILDNFAWDAVCDRLIAQDFYSHNHQTIFRSMVKIFDSGRPVDGVTLVDELTLNNELEEIGGVPYIAQMANSTPAIKNIASYADIVRERSILRQLIRVSGEIGESAFNTQGVEVPMILDNAEAKIFEIADQSAKARVEFKTPRQLMPEAVKKLDKMSKSDGFLTGLSTGFDELDTKTTGLQNSDLIIVAGRPSMGKTTFAMNLVENVALEAKKPVAVFSMEMPAEQLLMRMLSSLSEVNNARIRTGKNLSNEDWASITANVSLLSDAPIYIDDSPALSPDELRARVRRLKSEHKGELGMVMVDYIQLMRSGRHAENRATEVSDISRSLKALAKEMEVPVIALSQLNRSLENRGKDDRRPIMSDLRESGAIEQDADVIMFLYRDEVYNQQSKQKGIAELIIGKQRNGPIGVVNLLFQGQYYKFKNLAKEYYETMDADEAYQSMPSDEFIS